MAGRWVGKSRDGWDVFNPQRESSVVSLTLMSGIVALKRMDRFQCRSLYMKKGCIFEVLYRMVKYQSQCRKNIYEIF